MTHYDEAYYLNEDEHIYNGSVIYTCEDCGTVFEKEGGVNFPHDLTDGECMCGYTGECTHANISYDDDEDFYESTEVYVCVDGKCYIKDRINYNYGTCLDCNERQRTCVVEKDVMEEKEHWFDEYGLNGVCRNCGYVDADKTCSHENSYYIEFERERKWYEGSGYNITDNGDGTHSVDYRVVYAAYCPECDTDLYEMYQRYDEIEYGVVEEHRWYYNSSEQQYKCSCGATQAGVCEHANTYEEVEYNYDEYYYPRATSNGASGHTSKSAGTKTTVVWCDDCGNSLDTITEEVSTEVVSSHRFVEDYLWDEEVNEEDYCVYCTECEYVCEHANANLQPDGFYIRERIELNNDHHVLIVSDFLAGNCPDCGHYVEKTSSDTYEIDESHVWENDICNVCKWKLNCAHEDAHVETVIVPDWENPVVVSSDETGHVLEGAEIIITDCEACGMHAEEETGKTGTYNFGHEWNEEGKCGICSYENPCAHTGDTESDTEILDLLIESVSATQHKTSGILMEYTICCDCYQILNTVEKDPAYEVTEDHVFNVEGFCIYCDHQTDCTEDHDALEPTEYELVEVLHYTVEDGADQHNIVGMYTAYATCDACGMQIALYDDEMEMPEDHSFEWYLGEYFEIWYDADGKAEAEAIDGNAHSVKMILKKDYECSKCNMRSVIDTDTYEVQEHGHDWENGVCVTCGYEPDCEHTESVIMWAEFERYEHGALEEDHEDYAVKHYEKGNVYRYSQCETCGAILSKELTEADKVNYVEHVISNEGTCYDCGYLPACSHPGLEASEYELEQVFNYRVDDGADQHYIIGNYRVYGRCAECSLKVYLGTEEREELEDHSFEWYHGEYFDIWYDADGKAEAEAIDGNAHNVKMILKQDFECSKCNMWAAIETDTYEVQEHGHDWVEGVCVTCGYEPDCDHAGANDVWEEFERYEHGMLDDEHPDQAIMHYEKGNNYKYTRCTICGAVTAKELLEADVVKYDNHTFDINYDCTFCGYHSECTAAHGELEYTATVNLLECWYIGNDQNHHARYEEVYTAVCPECNMTVESRRTEWETDEDPHVKGELVDSYYVYAPAGEDFVIDLNADEHTVKLVKVNEYNCPLCDGGLLVYDDDDTSEETQHHSWDADGVCEVCGYENGCDHSTTVVEREERELSRKPVTGGKQHEIVLDIVDVTYCEICWQNMGEESVELGATKLEDHQLDENGWCGCGFLAECDHSGLDYQPREESTGNIWWTGDTTHAYEYEVLMAAVCPDCELEVIQSREIKEGEAEHSQTELWDTGWHHAYEHEDFLQSYDENGHTVKMIVKAHGWCEECNGEYLVETGEFEYVEEGHGFNTEGECHACPYVNPCQHTGEIETLEEFWEHGLEQVDDKQHVRIGNRMHVERCNDCWSNVVEELIEENAKVYEAHVFNADNVCEHCGYETTCDHSGLQYAPAIENYECWHEGDEGHHVIYENVEVADCPVCGMTVYKSREMVDTVLPHERTEDYWVDWDSEYGREDEDYVTFMDDEFHTVKQYECGEFYCAVCDGGWFGYTGETRYETWSHEWGSDGKCVWCGIDNICAHDGGVEFTEEFYDHIMTPQDEKQHVFIGELVREAHCIYCWQVLESTVLEEEHKVFEDHDINSDNFCNTCGYEFDCDHSAVELTEKYIENKWSDAIDEENHVHFTEYRMRGLCDKCGLYVYGDYEVEEKEEKHNLDLENLNQYGEPADPFVIEIDKECHTIRYIEYTGATCLDCWIYTEKPFETGETIRTEQHYYENDECVVCGYANTCAHKNTVTVESFNVDSCVSVDEKEHAFKGNICKETWCDDCCSIIKSEVLNAHEEKAVHELDRNGACVDCDFFVICDHSKLELDNAAEAILAFYQEDEETHFYEVWCYFTGECPVCGFTVQGDGYVEGRYAEHAFDQNGKCVDCGYVKPAVEPTPKPTAKPTVAPTAEPTPAPTAEPTVECVVEPGTRMAEALVTVMDHKTSDVEEDTVVEVNIVNSEVLMDEQQHETFESLSSVDQMMVLMKVLQYDGEADFAENNMDVDMSEEAKVLVEEILERFNAMEEEEKVQYLAVLAEAFPTSEIEVDGETREAVVIVLEVKVDDVVTYEQYTFLRDEETGNWLFYSVELVEKPEEIEIPEIEVTEEAEEAEVQA